MGGNPFEGRIGNIRIAPGGKRQTPAQHHQVGRIRRDGNPNESPPHIQGETICGRLDVIRGGKGNKLHTA